MSLRFVLLALLSKGPNTGYGMGRALRSDVAYLWEARLQQIYGELGKLQKEGLIETREVELANRPAKKVYSLSARGEVALDQYLLTPPAPLRFKDRLAVRLFCLERASPEHVRRQVEQHRDHYAVEVERLGRSISCTARTDPKSVGMLLALEAARSRARAEVSWCDTAIAILSAGQKEEAFPSDLGQAAGAS